MSMNIAQDSLGGAAGGRSENYMLLVTTNDNNVRLVDWQEKTTYCKYKGGLNESLQISASTSTDMRFLICGTEGKSVHFRGPCDRRAIDV